MNRNSFHENFRRSKLESSSDRSFGVVFAVVFAIIALWPLIGGGAVREWAAVIAAVFLVIALARPSALAPFNRALLAFGSVLHKITNPLIMGLVFYGAVVPTALIMRVLRKDLLRQRFDHHAKSYWIEREPPGPEPDTMKQQF